MFTPKKARSDSAQGGQIRRGQRGTARRMWTWTLLIVKKVFVDEGPTHEKVARPGPGEGLSASTNGPATSPWSWAETDRRTGAVNKDTKNR